MSEPLKRITYADIARISKERAQHEEANRASPISPAEPTRPAGPTAPAAPASPATPEGGPSLPQVGETRTDRASPAVPDRPAVSARPAAPADPDDGRARTTLDEASPDDTIKADSANRAHRASPAVPASRADDPLRGNRSRLRPGREQLSVRIPVELAERLDVWCFENRLEKTAAVELALASLLRRASPASPADGDTDLVVANEYERLTGRPFNAKDDADLKAVREHGIDDPYIVAGMLLTVINKRQPGPINSFAYMTKEIYSLAEKGTPLAVESYIRLLRNKLSRKRPAAGVG